MQTLYSNSAQVSFAGSNYVGGVPYTGPLDFSIADDNGMVTPVDPTNGASTPAVIATIDPMDPQRLLLSKVAEGAPFTVRAAYPGVSAQCSVTQVEHRLVWAAPQVFVAPICVTTS